MKWVVSGKLRYEENKWVSKIYESKAEAEKTIDEIYNSFKETPPNPIPKYRLIVLMEIDDRNNRTTLKTYKLG